MVVKVEVAAVGWSSIGQPGVAPEPRGAGTLSHRELCTHFSLLDLVHFDRLDVSFPFDPFGDPERLRTEVVAAVAATHHLGNTFNPRKPDGSPTAYQQGVKLAPRTPGDVLIDLVYDRVDATHPAFRLRFRHEQHQHLNPLRVWTLVEQVHTAITWHVSRRLLHRCPPVLSHVEIAYDLIVDDPWLFQLLVAHLVVRKFRKLQLRLWKEWLLVGGHKSRFQLRSYVKGPVVRIEVVITKQGLKHLKVRTVDELLHVPASTLRGYRLTTELNSRRDQLLARLQQRLASQECGAELAVATCLEITGLAPVRAFPATPRMTPRCSSRTAQRARDLGARWSTVAAALGEDTAKRMASGRPVLGPGPWARHIVASFETGRLLRHLDVEDLLNWTVTDAQAHAAAVIPELMIACARARTVGERMTVMAVLEAALAADGGFRTPGRDQQQVLAAYAGTLIFIKWVNQIAKWDAAVAPARSASPIMTSAQGTAVSHGSPTTDRSAPTEVLTRSVHSGCALGGMSSFSSPRCCHRAVGVHVLGTGGFVHQIVAPMRWVAVLTGVSDSYDHPRHGVHPHP